MVSLRKYVWVNTSCICIPCNVHSVIFFSCLCDFRRCLAIVIQAHILSGKAKRNSKLTLSPSCSCSTSPYVNISLAFFAPPPPSSHTCTCAHHIQQKQRNSQDVFLDIFFLFSFLFFFGHLSKSKLAKPNLSFILGSTAQPGWRGSAFVRSVLNI